MSAQYALPLGQPATSLVQVHQGSPIECAREAVAGLSRGGRVVGMTKGHFSLIDLAEAILEKTGPASLALSAWSVGIRDTHAAGVLLDKGKITKLRLFIDQSFVKLHKPYCAAVRSVFGDDAIRLTRTHAKLVVIVGGGWNIVVRSSMNLNRNPRFEQFDVDDSPELVAFFESHFAEITESTPPGLDVDTSTVCAVFSRLSRGVPPFGIVSTREVEKLGAPIAGTADKFWDWLLSKAEWAEVVRVGKRLGLSADFLEEALMMRPRDWESEAVDLAAAILDHGKAKRGDVGT